MKCENIDVKKTKGKIWNNPWIAWVEYAQHFGVPPRLMDWIANPLIALYFACS